MFLRCVGTAVANIPLRDQVHDISGGMIVTELCIQCSDTLHSAALHEYKKMCSSQNLTHTTYMESDLKLLDQYTLPVEHKQKMCQCNARMTR